MVRKVAIIPFDSKRREWVNKKKLTGGELPPEGATTPEELAHHIESMVCAFWSWPGNREKSNAEIVYTIALGALRKMEETTEDEVLSWNSYDYE
jgi:hypothetical protein